MKKYIKSVMLFCTVALAVVSCAKEELPLFNGNDVVYFEWAKEGTPGNRFQTIDSIGVSFAFDLPTITEKVINIPVKLQGYPVSKDRQVNFNILESSTGVEGKHFTIPQSVFVPADSVRAILPVTLLRTTDLKDVSVSLKVQLQSNDFFDVNLLSTKEASNADRLLSYNEFEITLSDMLVEPALWSRFMIYYLGDFSAKKLYLFAEVNGIPVPNFDEGADLNAFFAQVKVLKNYLIDQKAAGTPVLEEDGSEMVLGRFA
ncbi:DUF4843 domain-containing protein [Aestuariibaculum suncheonense]|uniref:DUF4843 domain-containing protein n=1 Tax=Aestuariibaculum suncheonense TaxID=1028745 RepID=A0A8J6Q7J8_9FLAO|nr:DUF4843 domain-containing protein [Aestuariibaculum suncheonense]MBD0836033.1 DUF4843 domain-containing protein [Aestuariibaculum suncheonense]